MKLKADENNFEFDMINGQHVVMRNGELIIDDISYEENEDDPTYDLVRELAFLKGLFK